MKWCLVTNRPEITYDWIDSNSDLIAFTQEALTESHFYLDTEFHREKTYFPQLALVQIATSKRTVIIDPLMVDMKLLRPLFDGPGMCVLHAAQQDL